MCSEPVTLAELMAKEDKYATADSVMRIKVTATIKAAAPPAAPLSAADNRGHQNNKRKSDQSDPQYARKHVATPEEEKSATQAASEHHHGGMAPAKKEQQHQAQVKGQTQSEILHKAKNNALQRFQDVLAYFENCNDSLNHEQAKSEQLEHELEKSHQACRDFRSSKGEIEVAHDKLKKDFEVLLLECNNVKGELIKTSKIYEELQSTHEKSLFATYSCHVVDDTCTSNPISFEVSTLKENVELRAQLDLITRNYGKLEENHVMLTSSHADLLTSHNVQKLAHEAIITKVTSSEPHVDNGTTSSQSTIFPCASPRNSSTHNVATLV
ncbi:hypothetical protein D1007_26676 [Hordeum vulgare]|nr:hypothetical protein D1007_26676 [Hordeum vulgare]